jgi:hypothetical protein
MLGFILLVFVLAALVWWFKGDAVEQKLADGSSLTLSGLKVGFTNEYTHGTFLSRTVGGFATTNGLNVAGWKISRPVSFKLPGPPGVEILSARMQLKEGPSSSSALLHPAFHRKYRIVISGEREFTIINDFSNFQKQSDGLFSYIQLWNFPRDSRLIRIRLEERGDSQGRDWHPVATFVMKNPRRVRPAEWKPQPPPKLKLGPDLDVEVGEIVVKDEPPHPTDIWEHTCLLPLRFTSHGQVVTNYGLHDGNARDSVGNLGGIAGRRSVTNGWVFYHGFNPLDPALPWRLELNFALESDIPATNLYSFTLPWPMRTPLESDFGEWPARISFVNDKILAVELPGKPEDLRLTFVEAFDDDGNNLDNRSGSFGQHLFWRYLKVQKPTRVHAVVALRRNYKAEFIIQPRYERH